MGIVRGYVFFCVEKSVGRGEESRGKMEIIGLFVFEVGWLVDFFFLSSLV